MGLIILFLALPTGALSEDLFMLILYVSLRGHSCFGAEHVAPFSVPFHSAKSKSMAGPRGRRTYEDPTLRIRWQGTIVPP